MSTKKIIVIAIGSLYCAVASPTQAQGTFQNLGFESANVPASPAEFYPNYVSIDSALPGWTAYVGTVQQTQAGYNAPANSTASITLIGPTWNSSDVGRYGVDIINGSYSVELQTGANYYYSSGIGPMNVGVSIEQDGTIPTTAESLEFDAIEFTPFSVSFNGNALNPVALSTGYSENGVPYTLYGADIAMLAGQSGELEFTANFNGSYNYALLDDITFSTQAVPEPNTVELILVAAMIMGLHRWRKQGKIMPQ